VYLGQDFLTQAQDFLKANAPEQYAEMEAAAKAKAQVMGMQYLEQKGKEAQENPVVWTIVILLGAVIVGQMLPKGCR
jgi:hypothetical protein